MDGGGGAGVGAEVIITSLCCLVCFMPANPLRTLRRTVVADTLST